MIADSTISLAQGDAWLSLAVIYAITLIVTELITNNAAAALMFPFAMATARNLDVNYIPFVIAVMMAASAGFATPIGYQTNLMVYGPGGYRFSDYVKIGVPLDILIGVITVLIAPLVWPFR
jgi:di/tricarboxylate transporter